jgi:hypothetical protein
MPSHLAEPAIFAGAETRLIYDRLIAAARALGPMDVEEKKTCVHLVRRAAFAGVHPRKAAVLVTLKTDRPLEGPRVRKVEQASKHRFHNDMVLGAPGEIDAEFLAWLALAYDLAG